MRNNSKKVIILGAGPSGLSLACNLLKISKNFVPIIIEKTDRIGGLASTYYFDEFGADFGGHKIAFDLKAQKFLQEFFSYSDFMKNVFINQNNFSVLMNEKIVQLSIKNILEELGVKNTISFVFSYLYSLFFKRDYEDLESFLCAKFGKYIYEIFLKYPVSNLLNSDIREVSKDFPINFFENITLKKNEFYFPKFGYNELWNKMAEYILKNGGKIFLNSEFCDFKYEKNIILSALYKNNEHIEEIIGDYFVSSIPMNEVIHAIDAPFNIKQYGLNLKYIDLIQVNFYLRKDKINQDFLENSTIYVINKDSNIFKFSILSNFSPYLGADFRNMCVVSVLFNNKCSELLKFSDSKIVELATSECAKYNLFYNSDINKTSVIKIKNALPLYTNNYKNLNKINEAISNYKNLFTIGSCGQFKILNVTQAIESGLNMARTIMDKG